jgi:hypothetical protein
VRVAVPVGKVLRLKVGCRLRHGGRVLVRVVVVQQVMRVVLRGKGRVDGLVVVVEMRGGERKGRRGERRRVNVVLLMLVATAAAAAAAERGD